MLKLNVAPGRSLASAHRRPLSFSTIERQIESPNPIPSGLVGENASKSFSADCGTKPVPQSRTASLTLPPSPSPVATGSVPLSSTSAPHSGPQENSGFGSKHSVGRCPEGCR